LDPRTREAGPPELLAGGGVECVQTGTAIADIDAIPMDQRRRVDRPAGVESPALPAGSRFQRVDMVIGAGEYDAVPIHGGRIAYFAIAGESPFAHTRCCVDGMEAAVAGPRID